jgi:hypothetical protein
MPVWQGNPAGMANKAQEASHQESNKVRGMCIGRSTHKSRMVGLVAQLKGRLSLGRYRVATIFVGNHSPLGYVNVQKDSTSKETIKAKHAFELYARER